jgi:hypothetical protein
MQHIASLSRPNYTPLAVDQMNSQKDQSRLCAKLSDLAETSRRDEIGPARKSFGFSYGTIIDAAGKRVCQLKHTFGFIYRPVGSRELPANVVEGVKKFLRAHAGRAELAYHDAGGGIGQHGCVSKRCPGRNRKCQHA